MTTPIEPLELTAAFAVELTAADTGRRTITGTVVPYGAFGNTSIGPVAFLTGAFGEVEPADVVLVREHDEATPLGRATELVDDGDRVVGTFRVSRTTAGDDALVEADDGLRAGLSVGARALEYEVDDEGRLVVTAAQLEHVGLVVRPAYESAQVSNVAAAHKEPAMPRTAPHTDPTTDDPPAAPAAEPTITAAQLDDVVDRAVTAALDRAAEAAGVDPDDPPAPGTPRVEVREPDITAGQYARALVLADQGDDDARQLVEAALADSLTPQHTGVVPVPLLSDMIDTVRESRPSIEAMSRRELPAAGMKFELPRWSTKPTTGQTGEGVEISSTATVIDEVEVDVVKIAGGNKVSVEMVERSSPAYIEELIDALIEDFRDKSNAYVHGRLVAGATVSTGDSIHKQVAQGIGDSFAAAKKVPDRSLGALDKWVEIQGAEDTAGRPLYSALARSNAPGALRSSVRGDLSGTDFALETDAAAGGLYVFPSADTRYYEQPGAPVTVRMMQVSTLEWEVAVYGFLAAMVKHPASVRKLEAPA